MPHPTVLDRPRLADALSGFELSRGATVLVHSSLHELGPIDGGPATLYHAIRDVLGPAATVVVPTHTADNSTTSRLFLAAVEGKDRVEAERRIPGFDPRSSPSVRMGAFAELIRTHPDAVRSPHPQCSFAAVGPLARSLMAVHDLDCHLGERSPLRALDQHGATILLLGVGYDKCTALHLAEYRLPWPLAAKAYRCYVMVDGARTARDFSSVDLDADDFPALGQELDSSEFVHSLYVGTARCRAIPMPEAVAFAAEWMTRRRSPAGNDRRGTWLEGALGRRGVANDG